MITPLRRGFALVLATLLASSAHADIVLTEDCQEDIRRIQSEMSDNKDKYTADARAKANAELTVAKTNIINPVKCRKNIQDAKSALRKGKKKSHD